MRSCPHDISLVPIAYAPKGRTSPTGLPRNPSFTLSLLLGRSEQHISPQHFSTLNAYSSLIVLRFVDVQSILRIDRETSAGHCQQSLTIDGRWVSWRDSFPRKIEPQRCCFMAWSWQHASTVRSMMDINKIVTHHSDSLQATTPAS